MAAVNVQRELTAVCSLPSGHANRFALERSLLPGSLLCSQVVIGCESFS